MLTLLALLTFAPFLAMTVGNQSPEELLVGMWKHHKEEVFLTFFPNGAMLYKIPVALGFKEIPGAYRLIDQTRLEFELNSQYGVQSGEAIVAVPQVFQVSISENRLIFQALRQCQPEKQEFVRIT